MEFQAVARAALAAVFVSLGVVPSEPVERQDDSQESLISPSYRRFAERELVKTFKKSAHREPSADELAEALWTFEERVRALPADVGRELGQREGRNIEARADFDARGPLALLANLAGGGGGPLEDLVASREALRTLFPREEPTRDVAISHPGEIAPALAAGVTLALPAGVFELDNFMQRLEEFPREVTLVGAGMDATLIVLGEALGARGPLEDFALERCTLATRGNRLFQQKKGAATIRLASVRVCGFDNGADKGGPLEFGGGVALDVRECRFEGGFGSVPGSGSLLTLPNAALIARFEGCVFTHQSAGIGRLVRGATLRYERCRFERVNDDPASDVRNFRGVRLVECVIERADASTARLPRRELNELFPEWEKRVVR